jgi:hypothetical protein
LFPDDCSAQVAAQGEHSAASTTDARLVPEAPADGSVPRWTSVGYLEAVDSAADDWRRADLCQDGLAEGGLCQADFHPNGYSERADWVAVARSVELMKGDPVEPVVRLDDSVLHSALDGCFPDDCSVSADLAAGDSFPDDSVPAGYPDDCLEPVDLAVADCWAERMADDPLMPEAPLAGSVAHSARADYLVLADSVPDDSALADCSRDDCSEPADLEPAGLELVDSVVDDYWVALRLEGSLLGARSPQAGFPDDSVDWPEPELPLRVLPVVRP